MVDLKGLTVFEADQLTSTLTTRIIDAERFVHIRAFIIPSGTVDALLRLNEDIGTTYAHRQSTNGAADTTSVSGTSINLNNGTFTTPIQFDIFIANKTAFEKLIIVQQVGQGTAGAANAPNRIEQTPKWANTTFQITRISIINTQAGDYAAGSRLVVLGHG